MPFDKLRVPSKAEGRIADCEFLLRRSAGDAVADGVTLERTDGAAGTLVVAAVVSAEWLLMGFRQERLRMHPLERTARHRSIRGKAMAALYRPAVMVTKK